MLVKSDGMPTYNWASVVDDLEMKVNFIIRGTDHITNTSKQVVLWSLLGAEIPKFAHVGLIGLGGKPLSKRDGAASMLFYREKGYDADAMLNFLVRMGWSPSVDDKTTKMLPREKMLDMFLSCGKMKEQSRQHGFGEARSLRPQVQGREENLAKHGQVDRMKYPKTMLNDHNPQVPPIAMAAMAPNGRHQRPGDHTAGSRCPDVENSRAGGLTASRRPLYNAAATSHGDTAAIAVPSSRRTAAAASPIAATASATTPRPGSSPAARRPPGAPGR